MMKDMKRIFLSLAVLAVFLPVCCQKPEPGRDGPGNGGTDVDPVDTTVVEPVDTTIVDPVDTTIVDPVDTTIVDPVDTTIVDPVKEPVVFEAEIAPLTKTTIDGVRVEWESGDEIDVVSASGVVTYVATPVQGDATRATFAKKNPSDPEPEPLAATLGLGSYAALYPSGLVTQTSDGLVVTLPPTQKYNASGSLKDISVMYATSESCSLGFQNAFGLLALTVKGDKTVRSIKVETASTNISGRFDLSTFAMSTDPALASKSVELDCGGGVALSPSGTTFYIGIPAVTVPAGELTVTATTSDDKTVSIVNTGAPAVFQMGHISPYTWTPQFGPIPVPGTDYLEAFKAGETLAVGGKSYSLATTPKYASVRLSQISSASAFNADYLSGQYDIVFLDYVLPDDEGLDALAVSGGNLTPADGVALVSRYSSHQAEFGFTGSMMMPKGSLALKNVCVRTNTWALQTKEMQKNDCRFDIEDCSFFITPANGQQGGLVSDNCTSTGDVSTVLGYFTLRNSVVVRHNDYNHPMFTMRSGSYGTIPYKDFAVENNAFIYDSSFAGKEVCNSNLFYLSSDSEVKNSSLNFAFRNNSMYGYKGSGSIIACCDPLSIVCENNVLEAKLTTKVFFLNVIYPYSRLAPATSSLSGNYVNNSGAIITGVDFLNGTSLKAKFTIGTQSTIATGASPYLMIDSSIGYLGIDPAVVTGAGCSYETKTWRSWSTESGSGTESYTPGHGSGDFNWK